MFRLPLVYADGGMQRLQDGDKISPSAFFQHTRYITPTTNWEIPHSFGYKRIDIPFMCFSDNGPFYCGVSKSKSDVNTMRLDLKEPMSGILVYFFI
jgi:hypothetical protein